MSPKSFKFFSYAKSIYDRYNDPLTSNKDIA